MSNKGFIFTILVVVVIALLGIWHIASSQISAMIEDAVNNRHEKMSSYISKLTEEKIQYTASIPEILILTLPPNINPNQDSLKYLVTEAINENLKGFKNNGKAEVPYVVFPNTTNKNGAYELTEEQIKQIEANSMYLVSRFDDVLKEAKLEIDRNLSKINTWVTSWLAIFAFLGILFPILLNWKVMKDVDEAKESANNAKVTIDEKAPLIAENQRKIKSNQANISLLESMSKLNHLVQFPPRLKDLPESDINHYVIETFKEIENAFSYLKDQKITIENNYLLRSIIYNFRLLIHQATIRLTGQQIFKPLGLLATRIDEILEKQTDDSIVLIMEALKSTNSNLQKIET